VQRSVAPLMRFPRASVEDAAILAPVACVPPLGARVHPLASVGPARTRRLEESPWLTGTRSGAHSSCRKVSLLVRHFTDRRCLSGSSMVPVREGAVGAPQGTLLLRGQPSPIRGSPTRARIRSRRIGTSLRGPTDDASIPRLRAFPSPRVAGVGAFRVALRGARLQHARGHSRRSE
jgi:hypothetical protein